jgi:NAD(P)-dependent dehydrogenase (short-subunit alcohol dehydrogenase family)
MIIDLTGKRAVVSGSTSGIGFAIAKGLAEAGAGVVINGRTTASVEAATGRLTQKSIPMRALRALPPISRPRQELPLLSSARATPTLW